MRQIDELPHQLLRIPPIPGTGLVVVPVRRLTPPGDGEGGVLRLPRRGARLVRHREYRADLEEAHIAGMDGPVALDLCQQGGNERRTKATVIV